MEDTRTIGTGGPSARRRLARAVVGGAVTALWYSLPDHVASRGSRAGIRTALGIAVVARSIASDRRSEARRGGAPVVGAAGASTLPAGPAEPPGSDRPGVVGVVGAVGFLGLVTGAVVGSVTLSVAFERAVHRAGQRAGRRGTSWPHTRIGVALGVVAALVALGGGRGDRP